jgi:carbon-monoxide dehydrogenase small subunit
VTIEGLASGDELHPIQQSFLEKGAVQCGFCMPGMVLSTKALLDKNPDPSLADIKKGLDGNICRCAGYPKIFDAVQDAAKRLKEIKKQEQGK